MYLGMFIRSINSKPYLISPTFIHLRDRPNPKQVKHTTGIESAFFSHLLYYVHDILGLIDNVVVSWDLVACFSWGLCAYVLPVFSQHGT